MVWFRARSHLSVGMLSSTSITVCSQTIGFGRLINASPERTGVKAGYLNAWVTIRDFFSLSGKFYVVQLANRTTLVSKHWVIILGLRLVTTCWSWAWTNRTSPSNGVGLGSPFAACSVYGDLTCSAHTVNNLCLFNCQWHAYLCNWWPYVRLACMPNMLSSWNKVIIIIKGTLPFISVQHASFPVFYTEPLTEIVSRLPFQNQVVSWNFSWLDK